MTHEDPRLVLISGLKQLGYPGKIAVSMQRFHKRKILEEKEADLVFLPFYNAAKMAVQQIKNSTK